ncbi:MAG: ABC transporter permease subunit [Anaerolineae bacterium]|nr:ABC transporter permease subunit [Anaerolineae bacterium]
MIDNSSIIAAGRDSEAQVQVQKGRKPTFGQVWKQHKLLYFMLIPATIMLIIFQFYPLWGIGIAFVDFNPFKGLAGSEFVGLENFQQVFTRPQTLQVLQNTVFIAVGKIVLGQVAAVVFALMVHEVKSPMYQRFVQTFTTLPHFLSWIIVGAVMVTILSGSGPINSFLTSIGLPEIGFLRDKGTFPWTLILSDVWKGFGFGAVIYLAALTQINPELYEAAAVDGAGRWARLRNVTLPGIASIIVLMACLSLGNVLNAGFDQILVLYNPVVYSTGDIIDTYVYRVGLIDLNYEIATVVGLFKAVVGFVLIITSYWLADRYANYRIF